MITKQIKSLWWVIFFITLLSLSSCTQEDNNPLYTKHPFETNQLIGHRGDCSNAPENTMPSFEYAVNVLGLQWIECDPCVTKKA